MIGLVAHAHRFALPADVYAQFQRTRHQGFFQIVLLQIDHARALVPRLWHQVELVHLVFLQKGASNVPAHAFVTQRLANP